MTDWQPEVLAIEQRRLWERISEEFRETATRTGYSRPSERLMQAFAAVPRHLFMPPAQQACGYVDTALPIGHGQTISQPFIVALMTALLQPDSDAVVLEIGTGSGYQTAVLANLVRQVYSLERIPELAEAAKKRLHGFGIENVAFRIGDGHQGWMEQAPFDAIMVTAAAAEIPPALLEQLKPGGRLVIPVGAVGRTQDLQLLNKNQQGQVQSRSVLPVVFVPLIQEG